MTTPVKISEIKANGISFAPSFTYNKNGYVVSILAINIKNNSKVWDTIIYQREFNDLIETDIQEIFLKSLVANGDKLIAVDEDNQKYEIDMISGKLLTSNKKHRND